MEANQPFEALCIFEDNRYPNFFPLSLNKPVFELQIGAQTLRNRIISELFPQRIHLLCRPYLAEVLGENLNPEQDGLIMDVNSQPENPVLFVNGRLLALGESFQSLLAELEDDCLIDKNGIPVVARLSPEKAGRFMEFLSVPLQDDSVVKVFTEFRKMTEKSPKKPFPSREDTDLRESEQALEAWVKDNGVKRKPTDFKLISHYWHFIAENGNCLRDDFQKNPMRGPAPEASLYRGVDLINEEDIIIGAGVEVRSGTVLDASEGPIIIAAGVRIEPNAIIDGPCFIGERSIIRGGAKVGKGTSIGTECRIGGEVGESIVSSYTNKQHEGFLGHAYIGSWVNIGAGSCNSDLKNNYQKINAWSAGRIRETGRRFLGAIAGDNTKLAINTRINTGTVIGFNSNVLSAKFPPKFVPSFTWQIEPEWVEYDLEKAILTAGIMMDRRNVQLTQGGETLFRYLFNLCRQSGHNS
ncbi:MAG: hypothetical protein JXB45_07735 [Candidatus Krumholzibacteriota bacterium]|nr:hypothetical protein [Candidatus Krumholzibacteriota bacterium]